MKTNIIALISGTLFGFGLALSQMLNPQVVRSFLDVTGAWDPTLLFVMAGALTVTIIAFPLILKKPHPVCEQNFSIPQNKSLDQRLIIGAVVFGIGWGLSGVCPGPAAASLTFGLPESFIFATTMFIGMGIFEFQNKK